METHKCNDCGRVFVGWAYDMHCEKCLDAQAEACYDDVDLGHFLTEILKGRDDE